MFHIIIRYTKTISYIFQAGPEFAAAIKEDAHEENLPLRTRPFKSKMAISVYRKNTALIQLPDIRLIFLLLLQLRIPSRRMSDADGSLPEAAAVSVCSEQPVPAQRSCRLHACIPSVRQGSCRYLHP